MVPAANVQRAQESTEKSAHKRPAKRRPLRLALACSRFVVERNVNPGMEVRPDRDAPLFVVSNLNKLTVLMAVFEVNLGKIKVGQKLSISVPAYPGETFPATVHYIGQVLDEQTRTIQVRCDLPNRMAVCYPACTPPST